jgi:hypothetical protein
VRQETRKERAMTSGYKWIIVLVAYDDADLPAQVLKERIPLEDDEQLAAFLRGGELLSTITLDNEAVVECERTAIEKSCLR